MYWNKGQDLKDTSNNSEFNSQDRYLSIVMGILEKLNDAIIGGDVSQMLRSLLALLNTTQFKIEAENVEISEGSEPLKIADLKKNVEALATRILAEVGNDQLFKKNNVYYTQEIGKLQNLLLRFMNGAGMIYPKKSYKPIEEIIEADY